MRILKKGMVTEFWLTSYGHRVKVSKIKVGMTGGKGVVLSGQR